MDQHSSNHLRAANRYFHQPFCSKPLQAAPVPSRKHTDKCSWRLNLSPAQVADRGTNFDIAQVYEASMTPWTGGMSTGSSAAAGHEGSYMVQAGSDPRAEGGLAVSTGERKERRGFASMSPEKQREIASKGGRAAHEKGTAHEWTADEARNAGRKGGQVSRGGRGRLVILPGVPMTPGTDAPAANGAD